MLEFVDDRTGSPTALAAALRSTGYLADDGLATAAFLALRDAAARCSARASRGPARPRSPQALAEALDAELIRLQCYEGIDATQALYDWDFPRQLLHLRALEAAAAAPAATDARRGLASTTERFLLARPILRALQSPRAVLLVDEIDRADDEFEAFLLEVLTEHAVTIPELGEVRGRRPAGRRAHLEPHPRGARRAQAPLPLPLARPPGRRARDRDPARADARGSPSGWPPRSPPPSTGCAQADLLKPPGVAETLDWARALQLVGARELDVDSAAATLGAVLKYREDADRVRTRLDRCWRCLTGSRRSHRIATHRAPTPCRARRVHRRAARTPGCPSPTDRGSRRSSPPSTRWTSPAASRSTGPGGSRCAATPTTCRATTRPSSDWFDAAPPAGTVPQPSPNRRAGPRSLPVADRRTATTAGRRRPADPGERLGHRGAPPPRPRRADRSPSARTCARCSRCCAPTRRPARRGAGPRPPRRPRTRGARCARRCAPTASRACSPAATGRPRPRKVVLLIDVSGSMEPYADALLRFAHVVVRRAPAAIEVFTLGTRLTRVTRELRLRDPEHALAAAGPGHPGLVGRHPARRGAARRSSTAGGSAARPGGRSSSSSPTAGSAATPTLLGEPDGAAAPARPPADLGEPARRQGRLRAGAGRDRCRAAAPGRLAGRAQPGHAGGAARGDARA